MAVEGGTVNYILIIRNFDFMSLFRHIVSGFRFSVEQFSSVEFGIFCAYFTRTAEELNYRLVFCCKP